MAQLWAIDMDLSLSPKLQLRGGAAGALSHQFKQLSFQATLDYRDDFTRVS